MKKILASILVLVLLAVPFSMAVSADIDLVNENIQITVDKAAVAPVIDGKLDADSYGKINTVAGDFLYYGGDDEFNDFLTASVPDAYISYDATNLYVFLSGTTTNYYCDHTVDTQGDIWSQSCIQISVAKADAEGTERLEIGAARNSATGEAIGNIWSQGSDSYGTADYEMVAGQNFAISLEGDKLNYEVAIPWATFLPAAPNAGEAFGLNFIYGWFADEATRIGVEFSSGCCNGKDASLFSTVTLTENVLQAAPVEVAPPADETPAADDAPVVDDQPAAPAPAPSPAAPTGDAGIIALAVLAIIASASVVILRKKAVK